MKPEFKYLVNHFGRGRDPERSRLLDRTIRVKQINFFLVRKYLEMELVIA